MEIQRDLSRPRQAGDSRSQRNRILSNRDLSRRQWFGFIGGIGLGAAAHTADAAQRPRDAAIITEYRLDSHADVIMGRLLAGYEYNIRHQPLQLEVFSIYP